MNLSAFYQIRTLRSLLATTILFFGISVQPLFAQFYSDADLVKNADEKLSEWLVAGGFTLVEDATDFTTPVGIALVKDGGKSPTDPLYLVTELRGSIKARLRNGEVIQIAEDDLIARPRKELPDFKGETGQTGICFSANGKELFTTGVYQEGWGRINKIRKWKRSGSNWTSIEKVKDFNEIFKNDTTGLAHQIGHCEMDRRGRLWVGVGDGQKHQTSHMRSSSNGKILRMTTDFAPVPENPFYTSQAKKIENYIYAMGVRNAFAIAFVGDTLYAADNGPELDRLIRVEKGKDYPWDNTNVSMTFQNALTFPHAIGPADMVYVPRDHPLKKLRGHLVVAGAHITSLLAIPVDENLGVSGKPWWILRPTKYYEDRKQDFTGLALAEDGIYIAHIRMHMKGGILPSPVLKLVPGEIPAEKMEYSGEQLIEVRGCRSCHTIAGVGGNVGPNLDGVVSNLKERLSDESYLNQLKELQKLENEPDHEKWSTVRTQLIEKKGSLDERVETWLLSKLENPSFENTASGMPLFELKKEEREKIKAFLIQISNPSLRFQGLERWDYTIQKYMEQNPRIPLFLAIVGGILIGAFWKSIRTFFVFVFGFPFRFFRKKQS